MRVVPARRAKALARAVQERNEAEVLVVTKPYPGQHLTKKPPVELASMKAGLHFPMHLTSAAQV